MFRQTKTKIVKFFCPSVTGVSEGQKFCKKIISFTFVLVVLSSLFVFHSSAETVETVYTDFWNLDVSQSKVWIMYTENGGATEDITSNVKYSTLSNGKIMGVEFKTTENWGANNILYFNFVFDMRSQYSNPGVSSLKFSLYQWNGSRVVYSDTEPNENTGKSYFPWSYRDGNYLIDNTNRRDYQETIGSINSSKNCITYQYKNQNAEYGFKRVCVFAYCTLKEPLSSGNYKVYFEFAGLDYRYSTMGEYLNMQIVDNQNANTQKIIDADKKNTQSVINNADKNASDIQANQDKNTQDIIDNQNQMAENEKNETNEIGNSGTSQISSAIPDYSGNIIQAFTKFTKPMIHSYTDCYIEFPELKIPSFQFKVSGLPVNTPEFKLMDKKNIDVRSYLDYIPEVIMILVRSVLGIALFVFCYKEFYKTVEYIMTLKGASR